MHPTRVFKDPEALQKAFNKYKQDLVRQSQEWLRVQYVGKDGTRVQEPQKVPMTMEGFKRFCRENYGEVGQYFANQSGCYQDFVKICESIKEEIRENQIIGGLLNFYNPSITQRLNGLIDKSENTFKIEDSAIIDWTKPSESNEKTDKTS